MISSDESISDSGRRLRPDGVRPCGRAGEENLRACRRARLPPRPQFPGEERVAADAAAAVAGRPEKTAAAPPGLCRWWVRDVLESGRAFSVFSRRSSVVSLQSSVFSLQSSVVGQRSSSGCSRLCCLPLAPVMRLSLVPQAAKRACSSPSRASAVCSGVTS